MAAQFLGAHLESTLVVEHYGNESIRQVAGNDTSAHYIVIIILSAFMHVTLLIPLRSFHFGHSTYIPIIVCG